MHNILKAIRKERNVEVSDLAAILGISESYYYKRENGDRKPFSIVEAKVLADFYGLSIDRLFFGKDLDVSSK